jgi:hypothetical protein
MSSYDKLGIINTCLGLTGNSTVNTEEDGSDEWTVASLAYEAAVPYLLAAHPWKFQTEIATLQRLGDADDEHYEDVYRKPQNCLGLIWVKQADCALDWKIVADSVYTTVLNTSDAVKAKVVLRGDPSTWPPLFVQSLYSLVRAGIYRGLNEDIAEAKAEEANAQGYLAQARTQTDREDKPRPAFRSRMLARRRGYYGRSP